MYVHTLKRRYLKRKVLLYKKRWSSRYDKNLCNERWTFSIGESVRLILKYWKYQKWVWKRVGMTLTFYRDTPIPLFFSHWNVMYGIFTKPQRQTHNPRPIQTTQTHDHTRLLDSPIYSLPKIWFWNWDNEEVND